MKGLLSGIVNKLIGSLFPLIFSLVIIYIEKPFLSADYVLLLNISVIFATVMRAGLDNYLISRYRRKRRLAFALAKLATFYCFALSLILLFITCFWINDWISYVLTSLAFCLNSIKCNYLVVSGDANKALLYRGLPIFGFATLGYLINLTVLGYSVMLILFVIIFTLMSGLFSFPNRKIIKRVLNTIVPLNSNARILFHPSIYSILQAVWLSLPVLVVERVGAGHLLVEVNFVQRAVSLFNSFSMVVYFKKPYLFDGIKQTRIVFFVGFTGLLLLVYASTVQTELFKYFDYSLFVIGCGLYSLSRLVFLEELRYSALNGEVLFLIIILIASLYLINSLSLPVLLILFYQSLRKLYEKNNM